LLLMWKFWNFLHSNSNSL